MMANLWYEQQLFRAIKEWPNHRIASLLPGTGSINLQLVRFDLMIHKVIRTWKT